MAFDKKVPTEISEYEVYDVESTDELHKVASSKVEFPEGFEYDPDYFYLWVRIISPGEYFGPNKNGDYFPEEELLSSYETFNEAHVFKNHENKKVEKAIGRIFSVRWNPVMKAVEIFKGIDKKLAPEIVRGFQKGFLTDVSMGCKVPYTVCSVCGNKARRQSEFCDHVKKYRMQYLGNGERVFEINHEPKFHDSSAVLNGAERVAKALVVFEEPETPGLVSSFRKAASANSVSRYIRLTDQEIEKVASFKEEILHPLLQAPDFNKVAFDNPMMAKIAELEKEVTGKILNVISAPTESKPKAAEQIIQIIKFLTEKRMDEDTLKGIGRTLSEISKTEGVPVSKAFSTFIGVSELMGIELFPTELHTILCSITSAKLERSLDLTEDEEEVYPSDFARGVKKTMKATEQLPSLEDPSDLFHAYDEFSDHEDVFKKDPISFFESSRLDRDLEDDAPIQVVKVIRNALSPLMESRSHHAEHLLPRLALVLGGHKPLRASGIAARDVHLMDSPTSLGDVLAAVAYSRYQQMRPAILGTKLVKTAKYFDSDLEKLAADAAPKGIRRRTLLATAVPAIYGASAFNKNRRENGRNTSDVENFIADRPDLLSAGVVIGGKPLTRGIMKGQQATRKAIGKGYMATKGKAQDVSEDVMNRVNQGFNKLTSEEYTELLKIADSLESGRFNAMGEEMMTKFASDYGFNARETAGIKVSSLLNYAGVHKEASTILQTMGIDDEYMGVFLKEAAAHADEEMHKAAGDFTNALMIDSVMDQRPFSTTIHGRLADAFIFKKLGDAFSGENKQAPKQEAMKGAMKNVSQQSDYEPKGF